MSELLLRVCVFAALIVVAMAAVKDHAFLERAHLVGYCTEASAPAGDAAAWRACQSGRLSGRPDLTRDSCTPMKLVGRVQFWRCPERVESSVAGA